MDAAAVAAIASVLASETRVRVLDLCDGMNAVGDIAEALTVSTSDVSYHLRRLHEAGLIEVVHRGRRTVPRRVEDGWRILARALG